jgi:hypothetical protein
MELAPAVTVSQLADKITKCTKLMSEPEKVIFS